MAPTPRKKLMSFLLKKKKKEEVDAAPMTANRCPRKFFFESDLNMVATIKKPKRKVLKSKPQRLNSEKKTSRAPAEELVSVNTNNGGEATPRGILIFEDAENDVCQTEENIKAVDMRGGNIKSLVPTEDIGHDEDLKPDDEIIEISSIPSDDSVDNEDLKPVDEILAMSPVKLEESIDHEPVDESVEMNRVESADLASIGEDEKEIKDEELSALGREFAASTFEMHSFDTVDLPQLMRRGKKRKTEDSRTQAPIVGRRVRIRYDISARGATWYRGVVVASKHNKATVRFEGYKADADDIIEFPDDDVQAIDGLGPLCPIPHRPQILCRKLLLKKCMHDVMLKRLNSPSNFGQLECYATGSRRCDYQTAIFGRLHVKWAGETAVSFQLQEYLHSNTAHEQNEYSDCTVSSKNDITRVTNAQYGAGLNIDKDHPVVNLDRFYIDKNFRRHGCGTRLLSYLILWAWTINPNFHTIRVTSPTSNGAAFYKAIGFQKNGAGDLCLQVH